MDKNENWGKYIKDGKVAVLYSPGYGAGWYTWNTEHKGIAFDREIVEAVLSGNTNEAARIAESKYRGAYTGGSSKLKVYWIDEGSAFRIDEYDGHERIEPMGEIDFLIA